MTTRTRRHSDAEEFAAMTACAITAEYEYDCSGDGEPAIVLTEDDPCEAEFSALFDCAWRCIRRLASLRKAPSSGTAPAHSCSAPPRPAAQHSDGPWHWACRCGLDSRAPAAAVLPRTAIIETRSVDGAIAVGILYHCG